MKKTVSQVVMIIGALVAIIGIIIDSSATGTSLFISGVDLTMVGVIVAIAFVFSKKDGLVYIGYLIMAIVGACAINRISVVSMYEDIYGDICY